MAESSRFAQRATPGTVNRAADAVVAMARSLTPKLGTLGASVEVPCDPEQLAEDAWERTWGRA